MGKAREEVTIDEIAISNMFSIEALVNLLEAKDLITKQEVLDEIQRVKTEYLKVFPALEGKFSAHFCESADGVGAANP